jgi:hypothetical protein
MRSARTADPAALPTNRRRPQARSAMIEASALLSPMKRLLLSLLTFLLLIPAAQAAAASQPPVVILIMDEFSAPALEGPSGALRRDRFPHLAEFADTATWYPRASTSGDMTLAAVPSLLSGIAQESSPDPNQTLFKMLGSTHRLIHFEGFSLISGLCTLCPAAPKPEMRLGGVMIRGIDEQAASVRGTLGAIRALRKHSKRPPLWTSHILLPHGPYRFLPSGDQAMQSQLTTFPGLGENKRWGPDVHIPILSQQRFLLQGKYMDRLVGELKRDLIRGGWWKKALVIITADHGSSFHPNTSRRVIEERSFASIANVPLLIKYPGQNKAVIDRGSAQLADVVPTIAAVTGQQANWHTTGLSLTRPRPEREINVFSAGDAAWGAHSWAQFVAQRQEEVDQWNSRFPGSAAATWIGPGSSLRGRLVTRLTIRSSSTSSAKIERADTWRKTEPGSGFLPVLVGAVLKGVPAGSPLVAALNGRIVTSGYSYRNGGRIEATLMLPASSLKRGHNRVRLLLAPAGKPLTQLASTP